MGARPGGKEYVCQTVGGHLENSMGYMMDVPPPPNQLAEVPCVASAWVNMIAAAVMLRWRNAI